MKYLEDGHLKRLRTLAQQRKFPEKLVGEHLLVDVDIDLVNEVFWKNKARLAEFGIHWDELHNILRRFRAVWLGFTPEVQIPTAASRQGRHYYKENGRLVSILSLRPAFCNLLRKVA